MNYKYSTEVQVAVISIFERKTNNNKENNNKIRHIK
jgi:hypothetical protein